MGTSILFLPIILLIGFPACIGAFKFVMWVHKLCRGRFGLNPQTAFVVALCTLALLMSFFTAPYWFIGTTGWLVLTAVYVTFVGMGAKNTYRIIVFLRRELDGDDTNDVPLFKDDAPETTKK